jgi:hypothetical protein
MTSAELHQNPGPHPSLANTKGQSGSVASATTKVCRNPARTFVSCGAGPGTYISAQAFNPIQKRYLNAVAANYMPTGVFGISDAVHEANQRQQNYC